MTVESKQDMQSIQSYIRKLQEIRMFLQKTGVGKDEGLRARKPLVINMYWEKCNI